MLCNNCVMGFLHVLGVMRYSRLFLYSDHATVFWLSDFTWVLPWLLASNLTQSLQPYKIVRIFKQITYGIRTPCSQIWKW